MNLSIFLGSRLSFNPGDGRPSPPGVSVGVAGIALALIVMMMSIAIVRGFKGEIRDKVTGFESQISIYAREYSATDEEEGGLVLTPQLMDVIRGCTGPDARLSYSIRQPGILKTDSAFVGVIVKAVSPDFDRSFIERAVVAGEMPDYRSGADSLTNTVVISEEISRKLGVKPGDRLSAHFFRNNNIASRRLTVTAIYNTRFGDYDNVYVFTPAAFMQKLAGVDSLTVGAIEVNGLPQGSIDDVASELRSRTMQLSINDTPGRIYDIQSVSQSGAMYFNWLELLDTNVVVILILMTLVSGFTLVSSLFILILDRVNTIGLLKALGATNGQIRRAFIFMAERLVARGLLIGNVIGLTLLYVQKLKHIIPLDPEAYYLSYVPVEIDWWYIILLNVGVAAVSAAMLILPSHMVSTLSPSQSMRYE